MSAPIMIMEGTETGSLGSNRALEIEDGLPTLSFVSDSQETCSSRGILEEEQPGYKVVVENNAIVDRGTGSREPGEMESISATMARSMQMHGDIIASRYGCVICHEIILPNGRMWACASCYHVYHSRCIRTWSSKNSEVLIWKCPTCKAPSTNSPVASCWCRQSKDTNQLVANSCGDTCNQETTCKRGGKDECVNTCQKICHPGPCELPICSLECRVRKPEPAVTSIPRGEDGDERDIGYSLNIDWSDVVDDEPLVPSVVDALRGAENRRRNGDSESQLSQGSNSRGCGTTFISKRFPPWLLILLGNIPFIVWLVLNVEMITHPIQWTSFAEHGETPLVMCAMAVAIALFIFNSYMLIYEAGRFLAYFYSRYHLAGGPHSTWKAFTRRIMITSWVVLWLAYVSYFPIGFWCVPKVAYQDQQQRTCDRFEVMVPLSTGIMDSPAYIPSAVFDLGSQQFHITGHNQSEVSSPGSSALSHSRKRYHVQSAPRFHNDSTSISIDFDLSNQVWKITSSPLDVCIASNTTFSALPMVKNGTWTKPTEKSPHAFFPELELMITNLYYFTRNCHYQPYITAFRTKALSETKRLAVADRPWSRWSSEDTVLRTVSFGRVPREMQVCARQADYVADRRNGRSAVKDGLGENTILPVALLATLGRQMHDEGRYGSSCEWAFA